MTETTEETEELTDSQKVRRAWSAAESRLRTHHREEFNTYVKEEALKLGVEWKPRPTKQDRARQEIDRILKDNPELIDELAEALARVQSKVG